jgi:hypothetical protein
MAIGTEKGFSVQRVGKDSHGNRDRERILGPACRPAATDRPAEARSAIRLTLWVRDSRSGAVGLNQ